MGEDASPEVQKEKDGIVRRLFAMFGWKVADKPLDAGADKVAGRLTSDAGKFVGELVDKLPT